MKFFIVDNGYYTLLVHSIRLTHASCACVSLSIKYIAFKKEMVKKNMDSRSIRKNKKKSSKIRKTVVYKQILSARIDMDRAMAHPYIILSVFIFQDFSLSFIFFLFFSLHFSCLFFFLVFMGMMRYDMELGKTQCSSISW